MFGFKPQPAPHIDIQSLFHYRQIFNRTIIVNVRYLIFCRLTMWPGRLPFIQQQPQTNLIPLQIPMQVQQPAAFFQQPLLGAPALIPTAAIPQPKVVLSQPLQYQPILNHAFYQQPTALPLLHYPRLERSAVYTSTPIAVKTYPVQHTEPVNLLTQFQTVATTDNASVSSRPSTAASPCLKKQELPVIVTNPLLLADFSQESSRFYEAFYELCCKLAQSDNAEDVAAAKLLQQSLQEIGSTQTVELSADSSEQAAAQSEISTPTTSNTVEMTSKADDHSDQQNQGSSLVRAKDLPVCQLPL